MTIGIGCLAWSTTARADVPAKTNIFAALDEGSQIVSAFLAGPTAASNPTARAEAPPPPSAAQSPRPHVTKHDMDLLPRPTVLFRDWRGSFVVAGAGIVVDDIRPLASNRTAILRLTAPPYEQRRGVVTRFAPYVQAGAGEWRIDPVVVPATNGDSALAGQFGGGVEITIAKRLHVAAEGEYTFLYGAQPWSGNVKLPRVVTTFLAMEATF